MPQNFNNFCSKDGFVRNAGLDETILNDSQELVKIGGSFEAIADRMQQIVDFCRGRGYVINHEQIAEQEAALIREYKGIYGGDFVKNITDISGSRFWQKIWKEFDRRKSDISVKYPQANYDGLLVVYCGSSKMWQECPFGCEFKWNEDISVKAKNRRILTVNSGTAHLARIHHLLEKGNKYGISAAEFYKHFM